MNKYPEHARQRAEERYGIYLSNKNYQNIKRKIINSKTDPDVKYLGHAKGTRLVYEVNIELKPSKKSKEKNKYCLKVLFQPDINEIITFLPANAEPDHVGRWRNPDNVKLKRKRPKIISEDQHPLELLFNERARHKGA